MVNPRKRKNALSVAIHSFPHPIGSDIARNVHGKSPGRNMPNDPGSIAHEQARDALERENRGWMKNLSSSSFLRSGSLDFTGLVTF